MNDGDNLTFFERLKQRILFTADIIEDNENAPYALNLMREIDQFFIDIHKPKIFRLSDPDNAFIKLELLYENLCGLLESNGVARPKTLTVFEFYSRLSYLKKQTPPPKL